MIRLYLEDSMKVTAALAGVIAGLAPILALLASPISGRIYDKANDAPKLIFLSSVAMAIGIALLSIASIYAAMLAMVIVGFSLGAASTVVFSAARDAKRSDSEYEPLAVGWVNSLSLSASFWAPVVLSILAVYYGYSIAWLLASAFTFVLIATIIVVGPRLIHHLLEKR